MYELSRKLKIKQCRKETSSQAPIILFYKTYLNNKYWKNCTKQSSIYFHVGVCESHDAPRNTTENSLDMK